MLVGGKNSQRSTPAWEQVYRALEHGQTKTNCKNATMVKKFPQDIENFANMFVSLQAKRHLADYSPHEKFYKSEVKQDISDAEGVMKRFVLAPASDRRAFAVYVLFKNRPK